MRVHSSANFQQKELFNKVIAHRQVCSNIGTIFQRSLKGRTPEILWKTRLRKVREKRKRESERERGPLFSPGYRIAIECPGVTRLAPRSTAFQARSIDPAAESRGQRRRLNVKREEVAQTRWILPPRPREITTTIIVRGNARSPLFLDFGDFTARTGWREEIRAKATGRKASAAEKERKMKKREKRKATPRTPLISGFVGTHLSRSLGAYYRTHAADDRSAGRANVHVRANERTRPSFRGQERYFPKYFRDTIFRLAALHFTRARGRIDIRRSDCSRRANEIISLPI